MSFKKNILKKIKINKTARQVIVSIGPPDSGRKIDKDAMRRLLEMSPYTHRKERDLDLYLEDTAQEKKRFWYSTMIWPFTTPLLKTSPCEKAQPSKR